MTDEHLKQTPKTDIQPRSASRYNLALKICLSIGSLLFAFILGEVIVRVFDLGPDINPVYAENFCLSENSVLGYELLSGSKGRRSSINVDGMRDREYSVAKPDGVFRIACIGDSVTYSSGTPQRASYPSHMERLLNEDETVSDTTFEVLNFGVVGYDIVQSLENLRVRALKYKPDLVIYQYCLNDPEEYSFEMEGLLEQLTGAQKDYVSGRSSISGILAEYSRIYKLAMYTYKAKTSTGGQTRERPPDEQWTHLKQGTYAEYFKGLHNDKKKWARVEKEFDSLAALSREHGFEVMVVIFPILRKLDDYPLSDVHKQAQRATLKSELPTLDLLPLFQNLNEKSKRRFARDPLHPNGLGNWHVAQELIRFLRENGKMPE
jgi:GDSL-like Lipase/Acylhydrolase family